MLKIILVCLVGTFLYTSAQQMSTDEIENVFGDISNNTEIDSFDWNIYKKIANLGIQNTVLSPVSLKVCMAILYEAAGGKTKDEIKQTLDFNQKETSVRRKFEFILNTLQKSNKLYELDLGSRIYLDDSINSNQKYTTIVKNSYKTSIVKLDANNPYQGAVDANMWVQKLTHNNIEYLVSEDDLKDTVVLLINTIYFKGTWKNQFSDADTKSGVFNVNSTHTINTLLMKQTERFEYHRSEELEAKIIKLPYQGENIAMYVMLPDSINGLKTLVSAISAPSIRRAMLLMEDTLVDLVLPKFKFDYTSRFVTPLQELGIHSIFENSASLPLLARGSGLAKKLAVSNIMQKSGIQVNEMGTTAFAATEVTLVNKFGDDDDVTEFKATRPFLFFIHETSTNQLLFIGTVDHPTIIPAVTTTTENKQEAAVVVSSTHPPVVIAQNQQTYFDPNQQYFVNMAQNHFNIFDIELLRYTAESTSGNFLISPASIKSILGLILEGAKGSGATQLREYLRLPENVNLARILLNNLAAKLKLVSPGVSIESANRIFVSNRYSIKKQYADMISNLYGADIKSEDFSQPAVVANDVNSWVNTATHGKITNLIQPESFDVSAMMVLANAVYFKGAWKSKFNENLTAPSCFYVNNGCKTVNMMETSGEYNYTYLSDIAAQAIELPYLGGKYSLLIVMPTDKNGLTTSFIRNLSYNPLSKILNEMDLTEVQLHMPKLEIKYSEDLVSILQKLGITEIFSKNADLSGIINSDQSPHIDNVVHKTRLEINEQGSTAAAATAAMVIPLMGSSTARMTVDHPFLFFIRDVETGVVLFEGRVSDPSSSYNAPPSYNVNRRPQPAQQQSQFPQQPQRVQPSQQGNVQQSTYSNILNSQNDYQNAQQFNSQPIRTVVKKEPVRTFNNNAQRGSGLSLFF